MAKQSGLIASLFLTILLSSCNFKIVPELGDKPEIVKTRFSGDYETLKLRGMWAFCFQNFQMKAPYIPKPMIDKMCDCYLDEMRSSHSAADVNNLNNIQTKEMGQQLIKVCNIKHKPKII